MLVGRSLFCKLERKFCWEGEGNRHHFETEEGEKGR